MIDDPAFKSFIFADENYLCFINEVGFYSALARRDKAELERLYERFISLSNEVWPSGSSLEDPDAYLRNLVVPGKTTTEAELEHLQEQVRTAAQIAEERQALLEGAEFSHDGQDQVVARAKFATPEERWVGHLMLLSSMVKHMELIPDADKRRILAGTLDGWVRFAATSLGIVSELAKHRRVVFNGITYKTSLAPNISAGELARRITLYMPTAVAKMTTLLLGTEKLRVQIEDGIGRAEEPAARQFFRLASWPISVLMDCLI